MRADRKRLEGMAGVDQGRGRALAEGIGSKLKANGAGGGREGGRGEQIHYRRIHTQAPDSSRSLVANPAPRATISGRNPGGGAPLTRARAPSARPRPCN